MNLLIEAPGYIPIRIPDSAELKNDKWGRAQSSFDYIQGVLPTSLNLKVGQF